MYIFLIYYFFTIKKKTNIKKITLNLKITFLLHRLQNKIKFNRINLFCTMTEISGYTCMFIELEANILFINNYQVLIKFRHL